MKNHIRIVSFAAPLLLFFSGCSSPSNARLTKSEITALDLAAFSGLKVFKTRILSDGDFSEVHVKVVFLKKDAAGIFKEIDSIEKSVATLNRNPEVTVILDENKVYLGIEALNAVKESDALKQLNRNARVTSWMTEIYEHSLETPLVIFRSSTTSGDFTRRHFDLSDESDTTGKIELSVRLEKKK